VQKAVQGGTTTVYVFSGSKVMAEYDNGTAPAAPSREYIYSGAAMLAKIEAGATQYYHEDHLSVRLMTDANGNKIGEQGHFPFGESWYSHNTTTKWMFTSYERDNESGLDYAMARFYNSRTGGFCSADPVEGRPEDPQSWNRYSYVENDPINLTDPSGKFFGFLISLVLAILNAVASAVVFLVHSVGTAIVSGFGWGGVVPCVSGANVCVETVLVTAKTIDVVGVSTLGGLSAAAGAAASGVQAALASPQQPPKKDCPQVPPHPNNANVDANIRATQEVVVKAAVARAPHATAWSWFINQVKPDGPWDYKAYGHPEWDDFGNFNFGATGSVLADEKTLDQGAALARYTVRSPIASLRRYGSPFKGPNYGNDPHKNEMIRQGIKYQQNHCGNF
jgi:RHS repeat-associated protein